MKVIQECSDQWAIQLLVTKYLLGTSKGYCCLQNAVDLPYLLQAEIDENASAGDRLRFCVPKILCDSQNSDPFWVREIVEYW